MGFQKLLAYQKGYQLALKIFKLSINFPKEERYSLTDQVRKSSRSVCANIAEAYRKRKYPRHFVSKLSDADAENSETQVWLEISKDCGYLTASEKKELLEHSVEVGRLIQYMISRPEKFGSEKLPTATAN
ncbi:MAG: four helix bundle protein [Bacteroidetes bacterium]|jgi:four helix bundle protein|nr:MAG: four helix bundle protein [Bacteroidota bacterium]UCE68722.1 MAG: four helix bundle protein [Flavobacteriaceae bacterium]